MRLLITLVLVTLFVPSAEAQQLPTAGELIGQGGIVIGESLEAKANGGYAQLVFAGYGITDKVDLYVGVGEGNGVWFRGVGVSFSALERGPVKVSGALFLRSNFKSGYGITPRITVRHEFSERFSIFGGLTVLNGPRQPRNTGSDTPPTVIYTDLVPTDISMFIEPEGYYPLPQRSTSVGGVGIPLPIGFTLKVTERWTVIGESAVGILGSLPISGRFAAAYKLK